MKHEEILFYLEWQIEALKSLFLAGQRVKISLGFYQENLTFLAH